MCGVIGYVGKIPIDIGKVLSSLGNLQSRGYDTAGVAFRSNGSIENYRVSGEVKNLRLKLNGRKLESTSIIGHVRWGTHGNRFEVRNAHPHTDGKTYVCHNGQIDNYKQLRQEVAKNLNLPMEDIFTSETDTEVLAFLISQFYKGDLAEAVRRAILCVRGTFGIAVMHEESPDQIILARRGSPLLVGIGEGFYVGASSDLGFASFTNKMVEVNDDELAILTPDGLRLQTIQAEPVERSSQTVEIDLSDIDKGDFPHFMLKEIFSQAEKIEDAYRGRIDYHNAIPRLGGLDQVFDEFIKCRHFIMVGCGTSYYAGMAGKYIFESLTDAKVEVELASEFKYRKMSLSDNTFVIALSQSGETSDTLDAIKEARRKGAKLLGIVNVVGSQIARITDAGIYNHAGSEIGVASTKNFTSQLMILILMALLHGRHGKLSISDGKKIIEEIERLPDKIRYILDKSGHIAKIARQFSNKKSWMFIGRGVNYPIAREGALKLMEIAYISSHGYAAGEMRHGPLALISKDMPTIAIVPDDSMQGDMINNIHQVVSSNGPIVAITSLKNGKIKNMADEINKMQSKAKRKKIFHVIEIPETMEFLFPILSVVPCQLLAYYCAEKLGTKIDNPRNIAKCVTVS